MEIKQFYLKICLIISLLVIFAFCIYFIYTPEINYSDYIVLKPVIPNPADQGGFAWHLHHVQCLIQLCELTNKKPIVYFDKGYYYSPDHGLNWWNYFFVPICNPKIADRIVEYGEEHGYKIINSLSLEETKLPYLYTNTTFQRVLRPIPGDFQKFYKKITLNSKYKKKISKFRTRFFKKYWVIGIHYRGTDKFASYNDTEDLKNNSHHTYEFVVKKLRQHIENLDTKRKIAIFVASDEQPFIDTMKKEFPVVISYNSSRSNMNTSGLALDTKKCVAGSTTTECLKLRQLQLSSVHRGANNIAPYKKGEDAVMDIWLLSHCNELFRTHMGNFSGQPGRINPNLKVYSL